MRTKRVLPVLLAVVVLAIVGALAATIGRGDALTPMLLAVGWCVLGLTAAAVARSRTTATTSAGGRSLRRVLFYAVGGPLAWALIELTGAAASATPTASAQEAPPPAPAPEPPPPAPEPAPEPPPEPEPAPEPPPEPEPAPDVPEHEDPPPGVMEASDAPGTPPPALEYGSEPIVEESTSADEPPEHEDPPPGVMEASDAPGTPPPALEYGSEPIEEESTSADEPPEHEDPPPGVMEASDAPGTLEGTKHLPDPAAGLPGDTTGGLADSTAFGTEYDDAAAHRTGWVRDHYKEGDYTIRVEDRNGTQYIVWETADGGYLDARTDGTGGSSGRGGERTSHDGKGFAENTGGDHADLDLQNNTATYTPGGDPQFFATEPIAPEQYSPGTPLPGDAAAVRDEWNNGAGGPGGDALVTAETPVGDKSPELGQPYGLQVAEWQDPKITANDVAELDADVYTRDPNDPNDVTHFDNRTLTGERDVVLTQGAVQDPAVEQEINNGQQAPTDFADSPDGKVLNYGDTGTGDGSFQVSAPNDVRAVVSDANGNFSQGPDPASPTGIQPGEQFNVPAVAAGAQVPDSDNVLAEVVRDDVVRGDGRGAPTDDGGYAIDERHVAATPEGPNPDGVTVYDAETGTWSTETKPGAGGTSWYSEADSTGDREKRALHEDGKIWVTPPGAPEPTLAWEPGTPEQDNQRQVRLTGDGTFVGTDLRTGEVKPLLGSGPVDGPSALPSTVPGAGPEPTDVQRRDAAISYLATQGELRDKDGNLIEPAAAIAAADQADAGNPAQFVVVHPDGSRHYVAADATGAVATQNSGFDTEVVNALGVPELQVPREGLVTIQGVNGERTNAGALPHSIAPGLDADGAEGFASTQENLDGSTAVHFDTGRGSGYSGGTNADGTEKAREGFTYPTVIHGEPVTLPDGSKLDLPLHNKGGYYGSYAPDRGVLRKGDQEVPVQVTLTPDGTGVQYVAPVDGAQLPANVAPELIHPDHRNWAQYGEVWLEDKISGGVEDLSAWADAQPNPDGVLDAIWTLDRQIAVGLVKGGVDAIEGLKALDEIDQLTHRAWFEGDEDAKRQLAEMDQRLIDGVRNGVTEFGKDPLGNLGRGAEATVNWLGERAADPGETLGYAATLFGPIKGVKAPGVAKNVDPPPPTRPGPAGSPDFERGYNTIPIGSKGGKIDRDQFGNVIDLKKQLHVVEPIGRRSQNVPQDIGGRPYSGHALDRMQEQGIMPSVVENTIAKPGGPGKYPGSIAHYDPENHISVILDAKSGRVVTVDYGAMARGRPTVRPPAGLDAPAGSWVGQVADDVPALLAQGLSREQVVARLAERIAEQRAKHGDFGRPPTRMAHDPNGPGRPAPALKATAPDSKTAWSSDVAGSTTKINQGKQQRYLDPASNQRFYPEFDPEVLARTAAQAAGLPKMAAAKPYGRFSTAPVRGKAKVRFNHDVGLYRGRPTNTVVVRSNKAGEVYVKPARPDRPFVPLRLEPEPPRPDRLEEAVNRAARGEPDPTLTPPDPAQWTETVGRRGDIPSWERQVDHYERLNDPLMRQSPETPAGKATWSAGAVARAIANALKPFL